jgi:hypothetical protein
MSSDNYASVPLRLFHLLKAQQRYWTESLRKLANCLHLVLEP